MEIHYEGNWGGGGGGGLRGEGHLGPKKVESISVFTSLSLLPAMASIDFDKEVFVQFKEDSRKQYSRMWS
jgi:hypothetical protein